MITLQRVQETDRQRLYHLLQKYLYELTAIYDIELDEKGDYEYPYFEDYFTDSTREAWLIMQEQAVVGFVLLNQHSNIGAKPDHNIAEFCVLPKYRKAHVATQTFELLCRMHPGKWEIKFSKKNAPAARLWTRVTRCYEPSVYHLEDGETVLLFDTGSHVMMGEII